MKTAYEYTLDLRRDLYAEEGLEYSSSPHERDVDINHVGLGIIKRHIENVIRDTRKEAEINT